MQYDAQVTNPFYSSIPPIQVEEDYRLLQLRARIGYVSGSPTEEMTLGETTESLKVKLVRRIFDIIAESLARLLQVDR